LLENILIDGSKEQLIKLSGWRPASIVTVIARRLNDNGYLKGTKNEQQIPATRSSRVLRRSG
jgi:hypothetical protein